MTGGCDIPTDLPIIDQTWALPLEGSRIDQTDFLPSQVTIVDDQYDVDVDPFSTAASLDELCSLCALADSLVVPTPDYTGTITARGDLPARVVALVGE